MAQLDRLSRNDALRRLAAAGSPTDRATWSYDRPILISGHTSDNVARVTVRVDGKLIDLSLSDRWFGVRWFFAELPGEPGEVLFYDGIDQLVEKQGAGRSAFIERLRDRLRRQADATPRKWTPPRTRRR
jgi:hypothetical protein